MTPDDIVTYARECIGTPFHHQGRVLGRGMDCAGVVCHVAEMGNTPYYSPLDYPRYPYQGMMYKIMSEQTNVIQVQGEPQRGDILLMRFTKDPQHLGIFTGTTIIHAYEIVGKCVEHDLDNQWKNKIVAIFRFVDTKN